MSGRGSGRVPAVALDERGGPVALAVAMDVLAQPGEQPGEIAPGERLVEAAELAAGPAEELGGVDVAQRVGREVAEQPGAPVDVLQAALGVVGGGDRPASPGTSRSRPRAGRPLPGRRRGAPAPARSG